MASHSSAKKSARHNEKVRLKNRMWKSKLKTMRKNLEEAIAEKKTEALPSLFTSYSSAVDQAASRGVLHNKNASRKKGRMALKVNGAKVNPA